MKCVPVVTSDVCIRNLCQLMNVYCCRYFRWHKRWSENEGEEVSNGSGELIAYQDEIFTNDIMQHRWFFFFVWWTEYGWVPHGCSGNHHTGCAGLSTEELDILIFAYCVLRPTTGRKREQSESVETRLWSTSMEWGPENHAKIGMTWIKENE